MRGKRGAGNDLFLDLGADYMHVVYFVKIHYTLYDLHTFYAICQKKSTSHIQVLQMHQHFLNISINGSPEEL